MRSYNSASYMSSGTDPEPGFWKLQPPPEQRTTMSTLGSVSPSNGVENTGSAGLEISRRKISKTNTPGAGREGPSQSPTDRCPSARVHPSSLLLSFFAFSILAGVAISLSQVFLEARERHNYDEAVNVAEETGHEFSQKLEMALLPLFSIAQFATELDSFADLPDQVGQAGTDGSLPFLLDKHGAFRPFRNVTGVCDQPELLARYEQIASAVKANAKMDGILHNLQLAPHGVICLLQPLNNTADFDDGTFLDSSGVLGLDVLNDPVNKFIARASMKQERLGIAGPLQLKQCSTCGFYLIARLPIGSTTHKIDVDGTRYPRWGFATALINWDELVKQVLLNERFSERDFEFQLTRTDRTYSAEKDAYEENIVILAESNDFGSKSVEVELPLETTNNEWVITVQYNEGFNKGLLITISVIVPFFISCLVYTVLLQKKTHSDMLRLSMAQEAKVDVERNMTAYFAHELRNPLSALTCALESMPDNLPEEAQELISGMLLCSSFMSTIMNNLLDVRKIEEGKLILRSLPLSLEKLVYDVRTMALPAVRPGVELNVQVATEGRDLVLGDVHRIQQVLCNVVTNAIKYTLNGSITLAARWERDPKTGANLARLECRDTGPGIPKEEQANMFERFTMRGGGVPGSGLGLAIAKQIVDLMNGRIWFESDPAVKPGTNCIVLLPMSLANGTDYSQPVESKVEKPIDDALNILIIDDINMNRKMLKTRIQKGIAPNSIISDASTGEEALQMCESQTFDAIIVDQYMSSAGGIMVGTDVVGAMRRRSIDSFIIGYSGNDIAEQFICAGADVAWQKPLPSNSTIIRQLRARKLIRTFKRECLTI